MPLRMYLHSRMPNWRFVDEMGMKTFPDKW
jgi:hypothetical protein